MTNKFYQNGFTLIELLLYVSIVGGILLSVSLFFATVADSRIKNQSISEVNRQGELITERIAQAIRNADSITSPTAGNSAASLTLAMPVSGENPTVFAVNGGGTQIMGYNVDGTTTDGANANVVNASKFTAPASGTITTLHARIASPISSAPNNMGQMAIYSGASNPTTLLGSSSSVVLTGNAWNNFTIASVSVTSGQTYWLAYNTNANSANDNNLRYHTGTTNQTRWVSQAFGSWPASYTGTTQNIEYSMYADIVTGGTGTAIQAQEGVAAAVELSSSKVQISNLTFTNLSRSSTPGIVQFSFIVSRVNNAGKNEYDYQKTFTASAALRWP